MRCKEFLMLHACGTGLLWSKLQNKIIAPTLVDSIQIHGGDLSPDLLKLPKKRISMLTSEL